MTSAECLLITWLITYFLVAWAHQPTQGKD